ncbi:MAG TPA: site-specific integrase [Kribbella sp.]|jgi:integrase/recombinase XerC/integrase/recombinase XerD
MNPVVIERLGLEHPLTRHLGDFLTDLSNAGAPANTVRAYRGYLIAFAAHQDDQIGELTVAPVRAYLTEIAGLAAASRKRATVASFCKWAVRHDLLAANPMDKIDTIRVPKTLPRPAAAADVAKVLARSAAAGRARICRWIGCATECCSRPPTCGARAAEVCGLYIDDLDLRLDDEHVRIHGKGGTVRTVLLDDRGYVTLLKLYLTRAGYTHGPLLCRCSPAAVRDRERMRAIRCG